MLYLINMQLCPASNMAEILPDETILALRHHEQGRQIDPIAALRQAKEISILLELLFHRPTRCFVSCGFRKGSIGTIIKFIFALIIPYRIHFSITSRGTRHCWWRT